MDLVVRGVLIKGISSSLGLGGGVGGLLMIYTTISLLRGQIPVFLKASWIDSGAKDLSQAGKNSA
jgi:hypothetical protein